MQIRPNIIGYHVNDENRCLKFIENNEYMIDSNDTAWLGYGMYFWDNEANANYWIIQKRRKDNINKIGKVKCNIFTDKMLDLTDTEQIKAFDNLWNEYCKKENCSKNQPLGVKLDRLFDYFKYLRDAFKVIRVYGRYVKTPYIRFIPYDKDSETCEPIYHVKCIYVVKDYEYIINRELMEVV